MAEAEEAEAVIEEDPAEGAGTLELSDDDLASMLAGD